MGLKIVHTLNWKNGHSNRCYGPLKSKIRFIFRKIILIVEKVWMINTGTISSLKFDAVCTLVVKISDFLVVLGQFSTPCCLVTMVTQGLRVIFFEVVCQGLLKNAFSPKSEKSWKSTWYNLVRSIKKLVLSIIKVVIFLWININQSIIYQYLYIDN